MGDRITIPGVAIAAAPKLQTPMFIPPHQQPAPPPKVARTEPPPAQRAQVLTTPETVEDRTASSATPSFAWPARGHMIAGFGEKLPNGQINDGINLALPEGTAVHAAEDGVVVYAGSELRGYGNLVLIHHPNGFVTAYAHASELLVKRNDAVKRGQVIARSGATGTVATPQLHFETRKGSSPVNPMQYLPAGA
jgi:murein DD-endopeptidase MepM/ murein hydrolase activator NlpD